MSIERYGIYSVMSMLGASEREWLDIKFYVWKLQDMSFYICIIYGKVEEII